MQHGWGPVQFGAPSEERRALRRALGHRETSGSDPDPERGAAHDGEDPDPVDARPALHGGLVRSARRDLRSQPQSPAEAGGVLGGARRVAP